ncbi:MAG: hypothetical protein EAZ55_06640 [Cytophagales bacterium]|nr:MAG: hypothetical protein EAZ55_06640 [Cytophagales bacterium]
MCDFSQGFVLCSCPKDEKKPIVHNKNSRRHKKQIQESDKKQVYRWTLLGYVGRRETDLEGECQIPSEEIGAGLEKEWVLLNLNEGNCFDFDYTPQEGDNLVLRSNHSFKFLSFIYRNNAWYCDFYNSFFATLEKKAEGEIKNIDYTKN